VRSTKPTRDVDFQNPDAALTGQTPAGNLKLERADWSLFRTVEGLSQRAGVPATRLIRLVLKELADNGLDTGALVSVGELPGGGFFVADEGPGIAPDELAVLFSINRPMVSTKLLRLPTRGALGNGLRVVAGAVLASGGSLTVISRDRRTELRPERDGSTTVVAARRVDYPIGTRVEIKFGPALPPNNPLGWAETACRIATHGTAYAGKSSPHWYDAGQFRELLYAAGRRSVRELVSQLDGCTGTRAGEIVAEARLGRAICEDLTAPQAARLLAVARAAAKPVSAERLGAVGPDFKPDAAYARASGIAQFGSVEPKAEIPYVVEAWATSMPSWDTTLQVCVNRTPISGAIKAARDNRDIDAFGCGLSHTIATAPKDAKFSIWLNITTPYMPITSDGKAPNLEPFLDEITEAATSAVRKAHRPNARGQTQKDIVLDNLDAVITEVSGGYRFAERQLLYRLRPIVIAARRSSRDWDKGNGWAVVKQNSFMECNSASASATTS
jgi:hypothetical protein